MFLQEILLPDLGGYPAGYWQIFYSLSFRTCIHSRGNCYDDPMAENSSSILKAECICRQKIATFQQAREWIDAFIYFYGHERS